MAVLPIADCNIDWAFDLIEVPAFLRNVRGCCFTVFNYSLNAAVVSSGQKFEDCCSDFVLRVKKRRMAWSLLSCALSCACWMSDFLFIVILTFMLPFSHCMNSSRWKVIEWMEEWKCLPGVDWAHQGRVKVNFLFRCWWLFKYENAVFGSEWTMIHRQQIQGKHSEEKYHYVLASIFTKHLLLASSCGQDNRLKGS